MCSNYKTDLKTKMQHFVLCEDILHSGCSYCTLAWKSVLTVGLLTMLSA